MTVQGVRNDWNGGAAWHWPVGEWGVVFCDLCSERLRLNSGRKCRL